MNTDQMKDSKEVIEAVDDEDKKQEKEHKHSGDECGLKMYLCKMMTFVRAMGNRGKEKLSCARECCISKGCECSCRVCDQLQNPVVAANVVVGIGSVSALLCGYAKGKRFLKGRSDKEILCILSALGFFAIGDVFLSYRYYRRLEKKK